MPRLRPKQPPPSDNSVLFNVTDFGLSQTRQQAQELQILIALYQATGGPEWDNNDGWLSDGIVPCTWEGVTCSGEYLITSLQFRNFGLVGRLQASLLWELSQLQEVDLSQNPGLTVDFAQRLVPSSSWSVSAGPLTTPSMPLMPSSNETSSTTTMHNITAPLRTLNISSTGTRHLRGIQDLGYSTLEIFDISRTYVGRDSIASLQQLPHLTSLSMNHLNFQQPLDRFLVIDESHSNNVTTTTNNSNSTASSLLFLSNLQYWYASNASLMGTIPSNAGTLLSQVRILDWSYNHLVGNLSPNVTEHWSNLQRLELQSQTQLTEEDLAVVEATSQSISGRSGGDGLTGSLPAFANHPSLTHLDISKNRLSGTIPTNLLAATNTNTTFQQPMYINLQSNRLQGAVPISLIRFSNLFFDVTDNYLTSLPSEACFQESWMNGAVEDFGCDAILCPPGTYSDYGRQFSPKTKCINCPTGTASYYYGSSGCNDNDNDDNDIDDINDMENEEVLILMAAGQDEQVEILTEFYQATGGPDWTENEGWADEATITDPARPVNVCEWFGVSCARGVVQELYLPNNNLQGTTTFSLWEKLPDMRRLFVQENPNLVVDFSGMINTTAPNLEDLILSRTATNDLEGISNARNLFHLNIDGTQVSGTSLAEVFSLNDLRTLNLGRNTLEQSIPESIGTLSNLVSLRAPNATLYGTLPSNLTQLTNLVVMDLSGNNLVGPLTDTLNQMQELRILDLHGQKIPFGGPLLAFSSLPSLLQLDLSAMALTGSIPSSFLSSINDKSRSIDINLKANQLTGNLPQELALFQSMNLDITGNQIQNISDVFCGKEDWMSGLVAEFGCDAILCPPGTYNEYGRMIEQQSSPCLACEEDELPFFGSTQCTGIAAEEMVEPPTVAPFSSSPTAALMATSRETLAPTTDAIDSETVATSSISSNTPSTASPAEELNNSGAILSQRQILELLFDQTDGLSSWRRKDNWLAEESNICEWYGVICNDDQIQSLMLSENGLQRTSPPELFQLGQLQMLSLDGNPDLTVDLSGIESTEKASLSALIVFNTSTIAVAGIAKASSLKVLDLSTTKVTGDALDELISLTSLESLNIGNTRMNREIPSTIGELTNMREFVAPNAGITGTLPSSIGLLAGLNKLDLSANHLIGLLPLSLQNLIDLQILDLHGQIHSVGGGIQGPLLPFDGQTKLTKLNLSENELSGTIPGSFLSGVIDKAAALNVDLSYNQLAGGIPESLAIFEELNIVATANQISSLPQALCLQELWMDGNAGDYGCDAILCPPNTHNSEGRQISGSEPCEPCQTASGSFFGSVTCPDTPQLNDDVAICPDGRVCYNGGVCVENAAVEPGSYVCDCSDSTQEGIPFAGFACEYRATSICHTSGYDENSVTSFCTNNGNCKQRVPPGENHQGCACDSLWEGVFCEYKVTQLPGQDTGAKDRFVVPPSSDDGMESWQMVLVFVLPALAILIIVAMIIVAYSVKKKANLKYINAENLAESEYDRYVDKADDSGTPRDFGKDEEVSELETPASIIERALASVPDMPPTTGTAYFSLPDEAGLPKSAEVPTTNGTAFYSLPSDSKDYQSDEGEEMVTSEGERAARRLWPAEDVDSPESATTSLTKSSEMDDSPTALASLSKRSSGSEPPPQQIPTSELPNDAVVGGDGSQANHRSGDNANIADSDSSAAAIDSSRSRTPCTAKSVRIDETPTITLVENISDSLKNATAEECTLEETKNEQDEEDEDDEDALEVVEEVDEEDDEDEMQVVEEALNSREEADIKTRGVLAHTSEEEANHVGYIEDVEAASISETGTGAMGKSLFSGVQNDDSVSFLENSVALSEDSERSSSSIAQQHRVEVSVAPSLARSMFGGGDFSETSSGSGSGELSLNF